MLEYLQKVIVPFVDRDHQDLGLQDDQPALAINHFKGQMIHHVTQELEESNSDHTG